MSDKPTFDAMIEQARKWPKDGIGESYWFHAMADTMETMRDLLRAVQTDPCNWLHSELAAAIEAEVGPAGEYRSVNDSGLRRSGDEK